MHLREVFINNSTFDRKRKGLFSKVFSIYFFWKFLSEQLQDIRLDLPTSSLGISISDFLSPLSSCPHRISLDCGCKSTAVKHIFQMFFHLFYNFFLLSLIVNDLQIHFSSFFYFPLPFLFLLSKFSIFNPQLSIDKKPACVYHFTPAFQQKWSAPQKLDKKLGGTLWSTKNMVLKI